MTYFLQIDSVTER